MANAGRLLQVLEQITRHPETHDQKRFAWLTPCGTVCCVAGHSVVLAGREFDWDDHFGGGPVYLTTGETVFEFAEEWLGLEGNQATRWFADHNSLRDLWELATEFTGGAILVPPYGRLPGEKALVTVDG